jgi:hypothetical protein
MLADLRHRAFTHQRLQVLVENLALAVGQVLEARKRGIQCLFAVHHDAQLGQARAEGIAAGQFAQGQLVGAPAHILGTHDFVGLTVLEHAILVDAGLVRKRIGAHDGLVGLHRVTGDAGHQLGSRHDLGGVDARVAGKNIAPRLHRHYHLLQAGIAGTLAQAVNGALHLARTVQHG